MQDLFFVKLSLIITNNLPNFCLIFKYVNAVVAESKSGPGTIKKEWITTMADDSIVFTCANLIPEK